jgi:hypothetical protein
MSWLRLNQRASWWTLSAGLMLVVMITMLERQLSERAADVSLTGVSFGMVLPLLALGIVRQTCNGDRLDRAFESLARFGGDRRWMAAGQAALTVSTSAALGVVIGALTVLLARHLGDPELPADVWASSGVGVIAGASYACWFTLGSRLGRAGRGRTAFLLLDWVLGSSTGLLAMPMPRGHVRNLLGAEPVMQLSQNGAWLTVTALFFLVLALAIWSIPR